MSVSRSYAKALFQVSQDADVRAPGLMAQLENHLKEMASLVQSSKDLRVFLYSPVSSTQEKITLLKALVSQLGVSKVLESFLVLLAKKGRLSLLSTICDAWSLVRLEAEGGLSGTLTSAHPMEGSDVESLVKAFSKKLGKKVTFRVLTDPTLLAGIQVTVNGVTYDGSLQSQLQKLHDHLMAGAPGARA